MKTKKFIIFSMIAALALAFVALMPSNVKVEAHSYDATDYTVIGEGVAVVGATNGFVTVTDSTEAEWSGTYYPGVVLNTPAPLLNSDNSTKPFVMYVSTDKIASGSNGSFYIALGNDLNNPYNSQNWSVGAIILRFDFWGKFNWDAEAKGAIQISVLNTFNANFSNVVSGYNAADPFNMYFADSNGLLKITYEIGQTDTKIYLNDYLVFTGDATQPNIYGNWCGCSAKVAFGPFGARTPNFSYGLRLPTETDKVEVKSCEADGESGKFHLKYADSIVTSVICRDWESAEPVTLTSEQYSCTSEGFTFSNAFIDTLDLKGYSVIATTPYGDVYYNYEKKAHTEEDVAGTAATCTTDGLTAGKKCSVCGAVLVEQETIPAGHDIVHHEGKSATCTEAGWYAYDTCNNCDYTTYEAIAALGHALTKVERVEATADSDGHIAYYTCDNCDKLFADENGETEITLEQTIIAKTGTQESGNESTPESGTESTPESVPESGSTAESGTSDSGDASEAKAEGCMSSFSMTLMAFPAMILAGFALKKRKENE